ncbi:MAG: carboxylesterase family protein, partial [Halieaceae bacterium]|jgi:para-nitrobenzyl esterase|nr:carboxylesterase family protein [Halieaceae bacterium]
VTVQYRLGALGWLYHPALQTGDPLDGSGNYGTLDLVAALEWIQANAPAFGGDPGNVSIVGESAGAANVLTLLISDEARGLFHKGVVQSLGGRVNSTERALAESATLVGDLQALAGLPDIQLTPEETADLLRSFDGETILSLANTSEIIGDGTVIPAEGFDLFDSGAFPNKVPLILGTNKDEYKLYTNTLGFNEYPEGPEELRLAVGTALSEAWRVTGADRLATQLRAVDDMPDIYVYRFNWGSVDDNGDSPWPGSFGLSGGAFHSAEIPFMMANEDRFIFDAFTSFLFTDDNADSRAVMADIMVSYWSSFAWMSDPNGANLPIWEPWQNSEAGFKAVTLDVSNLDNSPLIEPDSSVLTEADVYARANAQYSGDILTEVLARLDGWFGRN